MKTRIGRVSKWMFLRFAVAPLVFVGSPATEAAPIDALLKTSVGEIWFELYPEKAPKTVANFLKHVDGGHFEGGSFYRVFRMDNQEHNTVKIELIQGGLLESGISTEYDPIPLERTSVTGLRHRDGTLSMARAGPDTATSEFFICIYDQPSLDFGGKRNPDGQGFAAFGRVIEGMDIVRKIQRMNTIPPNPDELEYTSGQYLETPVRFLSFKRN
ncbi:MAG: peptidylprolyl isomerase [Verrucomicrobiota bacterium]|nr:peptidylprolyl isomerase [Verrucomicrobiota bacterium]